MIRRLLHRFCAWQAARFDRDVELHAMAASVALQRGDRDSFEEFNGYRRECKVAAAWWRALAERVCPQKGDAP